MYSLFTKLQSIEDLIVSGSFDWIDVYVWGKLVNAALYKIHNFFMYTNRMHCLDCSSMKNE